MIFLMVFFHLFSNVKKWNSYWCLLDLTFYFSGAHSVMHLGTPFSDIKIRPSLRDNLCKKWIFILNLRFVSVFHFTDCHSPLTIISRNFKTLYRTRRAYYHMCAFCIYIDSSASTPVAIVVGRFNVRLSVRYRAVVCTRWRIIMKL